MCFSSFIQDVHSSTRSAYDPSEIKGRSLALIDLERITRGLIKDSLAPSSRLAYDSAQSAYSRFCSMLGLQSYPASDVLVLYVADLSQRVCPSTIRSYLSAIRHVHLERGLQDPMAGKTRLELALKGSRRQRPRTGYPRLPITPMILKAIGRALQTTATSMNSYCYGLHAA